MSAAPYPNGHARDVLDDGEDVTAIADRDLVLRAVNSSLATEQALGRLAREIAEMRNEQRDLHVAVRAAVVTARGATTVAASARDRVPSAHEIAVEVADEITDRHTIPRPPTTSDGVRELARKVDDAAAANRWRGLTSTLGALAIAVAAAVAGALVERGCGVAPMPAAAHHEVQP